MARIIHVKNVILKKTAENLASTKKSSIFASAKQNKVPWMSGLVNGLQNRLRRFESARHLIAKESWKLFRLFFLKKTIEMGQTFERFAPLFFVYYIFRRTDSDYQPHQP